MRVLHRSPGSARRGAPGLTPRRAPRVRGRTARSAAPELSAPAPTTSVPARTGSCSRRRRRSRRWTATSWASGPTCATPTARCRSTNRIMFHHGVWVNLAGKDATSGGPERFFAAGEEKTNLSLPKGYGYAYKASDPWLLNYMIHNLVARADDVYITYDIDFVPATLARGGVHQARPAGVDGRGERQALPGVRRVPRARAARASSPTRRRTPPPTPAGRTGPTAGGWTATACSSTPPATCTPAACGTTCT